MAGEAGSGVEAVNIIDEIRPHIVLVDIQMPFMTGLEFAAIAKERYPDLKIIILTAYEDFEYARKAIEIGVMDYLVKPIDRRQVTETLKKIVGSMGPEKEPAEIQGSVPPNAIEEIVRFIKESYRDPGINLAFVAQKFGFNASYLSRKFKEETGKSFVDYFTSYRMEKACELAALGTMMYMTAEAAFELSKAISQNSYLAGNSLSAWEVDGDDSDIDPITKQVSEYLANTENCTIFFNTLMAADDAAEYEALL